MRMARPAGAGIPCRLQDRRLDRGEGEEDRRDHEEQIELDHRHPNGKVREEEEVKRLGGDPQVEQRGVEEPFAAHHRDPGDRADEEAGEERGQRDDEQRESPPQVGHHQCQVIRDPEPEQECHNRRDHRVEDRIAQGADEDVRVGQESVVIEREDAVEAAQRRLEKADDDHDHNRDDQEYQQPGTRARPGAAPRRCPRPGVAGRPKPGARRGRPPARRYARRSWTSSGSHSRRTGSPSTRPSQARTFSARFATIV